MKNITKMGRITHNSFSELSKNQYDIFSFTMPDNAQTTHTLEQFAKGKWYSTCMDSQKHHGWFVSELYHQRLTAFCMCA